MTSGVTSEQISDGEYGGKVFRSTYSFIAQKSDNEISVTCTPKWEGIEYTQYKQDVNLNVTCKLHVIHKLYQI